MTKEEILSMITTYMDKYIDTKDDSIKCEFNAKLTTIYAKFDAIEQARIITSLNLEKRLDGMNEFRDALNDALSRFLSTDEYKRGHDKVLDDIRILREDRARMEGKADQKSVNNATIIAVGGLLLGIIGAILSVVSIVVR